MGSGWISVFFAPSSDAGYVYFVEGARLRATEADQLQAAVMDRFPARTSLCVRLPAPRQARNAHFDTAIPGLPF